MKMIPYMHPLLVLYSPIPKQLCTDDRIIFKKMRLNVCTLCIGYSPASPDLSLLPYSDITLGSDHPKASDH